MTKNYLGYRLFCVVQDVAESTLAYTRVIWTRRGVVSVFFSGLHALRISFSSATWCDHRMKCRTIAVNIGELIKKRRILFCPFLFGCCDRRFSGKRPLVISTSPHSLSTVVLQNAHLFNSITNKLPDAFLFNVDFVEEMFVAWGNWKVGLPLLIQPRAGNCP